MISEAESYSMDERSRLRRTNKPMMEKKRRARINQSLSELKQLLIDGKQNSPSHAKWEKADILEMTVDYMKKLLADGRFPVSSLCSRCEDMEPIDVEKNMDTASERTLPYHSSPSNTNTTTSPAPSPCTSEGPLDNGPAVKKRKLEVPLPHPTPSMPAVPHPVYPRALNPVMPQPMPMYSPQLLNSLALQQQYMMLAKAQAAQMGLHGLPHPTPQYNPYTVLKISTGVSQ